MSVFGDFMTSQAVKKDQDIGDLQQQLDAANQRVEAAERKLATVSAKVAERIRYWQPVIDRGQTGKHEASHRVAELKLIQQALAQIEQPQSTPNLAVIREQVQFVKDWFLKLEDGLPDTDPLTAIRRKYHAPVHAALDEALARIEQPQQQLPGEDPPFEQCQCSACVELRKRLKAEV